jgi:hypothetical protein
MQPQSDWRATIEGIQAAAALQGNEGCDSLEILALMLLRHSSSSNSSCSTAGASNGSANAAAATATAEAQQALLCALLHFRTDNR